MYLVSKCCVGIECRYRGNGTFKKINKRLGLKEDFLAAESIASADGHV